MLIPLAAAWAADPPAAPAPAAAAAPAPAHAEDEVAARALASERYGKEIPWAALCFARPAFGEVRPLVVGVRRAETGCEPYGLVVSGAWTALDAGLPALVPDFAKRGASARDEAAADYVDRVLLAFYGAHTPDGTARGGVVARGYERRDGRPGRSADATRTVRFDGEGRITANEESVVRRHATRLYLQHNEVRGLAPDQLAAGLSTTMGGVDRCWQEAWELDRSLVGTVHYRYQVREGKAQNVAQVDAATLPPEVVRCMGLAVGRSTWDPALAGAAITVFVLDRKETPP